VARFYVDTSAYLANLLGDVGGDDVARDLAGGDLLSSTLLVIESQRNLVRRARERGLSDAVFRQALDQLAADAALFTLRDLTLDLCLAPTMPMLSTPRSLDLVHLRTALWFHAREPLTRFISLDAAQAAAARELGLPV